MRHLSLLAAIFIFSACSKNKTAKFQCSTNTTISYQEDIRPILNLKCNNCHSYPGIGGIYLDSFQMVHDLALNGALMGSILSEPNYTPMPPEGNSLLDSCDFNLIKSWVDNGAPFN